MSPKIKKTFSLSVCIISSLILFFSTNAYAADFRDAMRAFNRSDYTAAYAEFKTLAEQGDPKAEFMLGSMLGLGKRASKDLLMSVAWIRKSAEQGFPPAEYLLGVSFQTGQVLPKDYSKAAKWYRKAANQGYAAAQASLGALYG